MAAPLPFPTDHPRPPPARKSVALAVALAALFGPLGLFYVSTPGALFTLFLAIVVGVSTVGLGLIPLWILCIGWAYVAASQSAPHDEPPPG